MWKTQIDMLLETVNPSPTIIYLANSASESCNSLWIGLGVTDLNNNIIIRYEQDGGITYHHDEDRDFEDKWHNVDWAGERLATGREAEQKALACIDDV